MPQSKPKPATKPLAEARAEQEQPAGEFQIEHEATSPPQKPPRK